MGKVHGARLPLLCAALLTFIGPSYYLMRALFLPNRGGSSLRRWNLRVVGGGSVRSPRDHLFQLQSPKNAPFSTTFLPTSGTVPSAFRAGNISTRTLSSTSTPSPGPERIKNANSNRQNVSGSSKKGKAQRGGKSAIGKTKELLNVELFPLGSFTPGTWGESRRLLEWWIKLETPGAVKTALQVLERSVREQKVAMTKSEDAEASKHGSWVTNEKLLGRLLKSWRSCVKQGKTVIPPIALLSRLGKLTDTLPGFRFDVKAFGVILGVAVDQSPPESVATTAETLLNFAVKKAANGNPEIQPNTAVWGQILKAWKKSDARDAPERADAVLERMRSQGIEPDMLVFDSVIHVHALKGNTDRSEDLLRQMIEEYENGNETVKPGTVSCNMVLLSYLKSSQRDDAQRAEQFLDLMRQGTISGVQPNSVSYNTVMECFARVGDTKGAEAVMERMKEHLGKESDLAVAQSSISYAILMEGWAKARDPERAEEMLRDVLEKSLTNPSLRMFNAVLKAFAESRDPDASERAKNILDLLQENDKCVALGLSPSVDGFNSYLTCIAKSNQTDAGKESESVICRMEELAFAGDANAGPDGLSFIIAIKTCLRSGDQVRAEALLQKAHESGISPEHLDQIRSAWSKTEPLTIVERAGQLLSRAGSTETTPVDIWDVNLVLAGLASSTEHISLELLETIYATLVAGDLHVDPDQTTYFIVVACLARSGRRDELEKADQILRQMAAAENPTISPNSVLYGQVVEEWIRASDLERAESLIVSMQKDYLRGNGSAKPDWYLLLYLMNACINKGDIERAQAVFRRMQEFHRDGYLGEGPTITEFESLLEAWKQSDHPQKDEHVSMLELELKSAFGDKA
jgi:pentatricopeptide repeat protein